MEKLTTLVYGKEAILFIKETFGDSARVLSHGFCDIIKEDFIKMELDVINYADAFNKGRILENNIIIDAHFRKYGEKTN